MSSALQNRLVGTVIIVALVVIFLPDILDGEKQSNNAVFVDIPENNQEVDVKPPAPFPSEEVIEATRRPVEIIEESDVTDSKNTTDATDLINQQALAANRAALDKDVQAQNIEQQNQNNDDALAKRDAVDETVTDNSLAQQTISPANQIRNDAGFIVQLGSFRHQKNVNELLDKLSNAGYRAFSRKVDTSAGRLTKVFVGPELERETLDKALPHLNEITGLKGKVASFAEATN